MMLNIYSYRRKSSFTEEKEEVELVSTERMTASEHTRSKRKIGREMEEQDQSGERPPRRINRGK